MSIGQQPTTALNINIPGTNVPLAGTGGIVNGSPSITSSSESSTPFLDSLNDAVKQANEAAHDAAVRLNQTPQYSSSSGAQPVMPVPSLKSGLFAGASPTNLSYIRPQTRAGARAKAIGQISGLAAGFVGKWMQHKEAQKTQAIAQDVNRVLELQKGLDEANQVLATDPNNAQAKAIIQRNNALIGSVLDGKNGKDVAKAFDVTYGEGAKESAKDTSDKDKQHKQAMTLAQKQAVQDEKLKQFESQMPGHMAPNPAYETNLKSYQEAQKQATEATKVYMDTATKVYETEGKNARTAATVAQKEQAANQADKTKRDIAYAADETRIKEAEIRASALRDVMSMRVKSQQGQQTAYRIYQGALEDVKTIQQEIEKNNEAITKNRNTNNADKDKALGQQLNARDKQLQAQLKDAQDQKNAALGYAMGDDDAAAMLSIYTNDDPNAPK